MYEVYERLLEEKGLTSADVSKATGIRQSTLSTFKKRNSDLSAKNAQKIANYLGVSVDYLLSGEERDFNDKFISEWTFESYLKSIGWEAKLVDRCINISNGTISVNVSINDFSDFESDIRNRCINTIKEFINVHVDDIQLRAAHSRTDTASSDRDRMDDIRKMKEEF